MAARREDIKLLLVVHDVMGNDHELLANECQRLRDTVLILGGEPMARRRRERGSRWRKLKALRILGAFFMDGLELGPLRACPGGPVKPIVRHQIIHIGALVPLATRPPVLGEDPRGI